jgi:hypothetical protein
VVVCADVAQVALEGAFGDKGQVVAGEDLLDLGKVGIGKGVIEGTDDMELPAELGGVGHGLKTNRKIRWVCGLLRK